jgi:hypothetical protein
LPIRSPSEIKTIVVPASGLTLRAVAPADDRSAAGERAGRQVLETQDLLHDRALAVHGPEPNVADDPVNSRSS